MEKKRMAKPDYQVNLKDVRKRHARPLSAASESVMLTAKQVFGRETSLLFAERVPGYHTKPHKHDSEQMNYIVSGEIWFYVDGHGYRCGPGDVMRIPRNKPHWAWNRGTELTVVFESHSPPLIGTKEALWKEPKALLAPDEPLDSVAYAYNELVDMDPAQVAEIEERSFQEEGRLAPA
jgi:quercetin dioxygenase-like cupin family protein